MYILKISLVVFLLLTGCQSSKVKKNDDLKGGTLFDFPNLLDKSDVCCHKIDPTGRYISYSHWNGTDLPQIWIFDSETNIHKQLTYNDGINLDSEYSVGGDQIFYSSDTDEKKESFKLKSLMAKTFVFLPLTLPINLLQGSDIYSSDLKGKSISKLTQSNRLDRFPNALKNSLYYLSSFKGRDSIILFDLLSHRSRNIYSTKSGKLIKFLKLNRENKDIYWLETDKKGRNHIIKSKNPYKKQETVFSTVKEIHSFDISNEETPTLAISYFDDDNKAHQLALFDSTTKCEWIPFQQKNNKFFPVFGPKSDSISFTTEISKGFIITKNPLKESKVCSEEAKKVE